jgi:hypothetical protein
MVFHAGNYAQRAKDRAKSTDGLVRAGNDLLGHRRASDAEGIQQRIARRAAQNQCQLPRQFKPFLHRGVRFQLFEGGWPKGVTLCLKSCCAACAQNVAKSDGILLPVAISQAAALKAASWLGKIVVHHLIAARINDGIANIQQGFGQTTFGVTHKRCHRHHSGTAPRYSCPPQHNRAT